MSATVASMFNLPDPVHGSRLRPDGWRRVLCGISTKDGLILVRAFEHQDAPGLAYHRVHGVRDISYTVTHKASGLRCSPVTLSHAEARAVLGDLAAGLDWTQPRTIIVKTPAYQDRCWRLGSVYSDCSPPWLPPDAEEDHL